MGTVPPAPYGPGGSEYASTGGVRRYGNTGGVAGGIGQPGGSISADGRGLLEGTWIFIYEVNAALPRLPNLPRRGHNHPTDGRLKCYKTDSVFGPNGECRVTASYIGLERDPTEPQIEITGSTSETPIVFHPGFPAWAIETPGTPAKGQTKGTRTVWKRWVKENDSNEFERFIIGQTPGDLGGVEAYLTPRTTVRCTYYTGSTNAVKAAQGGLGVASETPGFFPSSLIVSSPANWLLNSSSVSEYGTIYKITEEWMLSESGKPWNKFIYGPFGGGGGGDGKFTNFQGKWTGINWGSLSGSGTTTKYSL